jgi:hypothetical protein
MIAIICTLLGHKYKLLRRITGTVRECVCERCGQEFGISDEVRSVIPLDSDLREQHDRLIWLQQDWIKAWPTEEDRRKILDQVWLAKKMLGSLENERILIWHKGVGYGIPKQVAQARGISWGEVVDREDEFARLMGVSAGVDPDDL